MKIVFVAYLHGFGGAEKQIILLANEMITRGNEVSLISLSVNNPCYKIDDRINYIFLPDKGTGFSKYFGRFTQLKEKLKLIKPDIVVNFWFQSAYFEAFMSKKIVPCVVYSERGDPGDKEYNGLLGFIRKIALPRIDGFVFQSSGAQKYFNEKVQKRSVVIANPVFINKSDYPEVIERKKKIVSIGRLNPQKNQKLLINAFALCSKSNPDYCLEIYGEGELREELQDLVNSLGLDERVCLRGAISNVHEKIFDAALFVLSSDFEGLPNALIEAMALGLPCISTDCKPGGARDIINDNEDGIIVPCNNVAALSDAMCDLLGNRDKAEKFGERASENIKRLHKENIYNAWEDFFIGLVLGEKNEKNSR